jgi:DNA sulfur modification protein DndD
VLVKARRGRQAAAQQLSEIEEQLINDTAELRRLQARRENLGTGASESQRADLESRRKATREELSELCARIAENVPAVAPVLSNMALVRAALEAVEVRLSAAGTAEASLIRRIKDQLPAWLKGAPISLSDQDRIALREILELKLDSLIDAGVDAGLFTGMEIGRAERLRADLLKWTVAGSELKSIHAANLIDAFRLQGELNQIEDSLTRIEVGSQSNLEEYKRVMTSIATIEERIADMNQRKGQQQTRQSEAEEEINRQERRLKYLESSQVQATKNADEARFIRRVARTLNDLREALRTSIRAEVEAMISDRFISLVFEHPLVHSVELDDTYTMYFKDENGKRIGNASLSSGLKQLAATALLWAMKDAAGRDFPVIIDTPLGRIDRENQNNLLINYYPRISSQVIILPTNSEIDTNKLGVLDPHVAGHYTIRNEDGDRARIDRGSLVESV